MSSSDEKKLVNGSDRMPHQCRFGILPSHCRLTLAHYRRSSVVHLQLSGCLRISYIWDKDAATDLRGCQLPAPQQESSTVAQSCPPPSSMHQSRRSHSSASGTPAQLHAAVREEPLPAPACEEA